MTLLKAVLEHVCDLTVELASILEMEAGLAGRRRILPIAGETVSGLQLEGRILDLGTDWRTLFSNGVTELDTRFAMETRNGAVFEILNYWFRKRPVEAKESVAGFGYPAVRTCRGQAVHNLSAGGKTKTAGA